MKKVRRIATFALAIIVLGVGASAASAKTVGQRASGSTVSILTGQSLTIKVGPADSGSTGFHWRVARKPARSVLRLSSDRTSGNRQVFTYRARGVGATPLKLQYVPPGRGRRAVKTFRLIVIVNAPAPKLGCNPLGAATVARSGLARVFKITRSVIVSQGGTPVRFIFDAYYGCELSQDRAFQLGVNGGASSSVRDASENEYSNLTLRRAVVGYVFVAGCPFSSPGCVDRSQPLVESQDLHTGKLIRAVGVGGGGLTADNPVSGLVMSDAGGLAWIEQDTFGAHDNEVHRSDLPPEADEAFATDSESLDSGDQGRVDPDSLRFDGTSVTWLRAGALQRATLR